MFIAWTSQKASKFYKIVSKLAIVLIWNIHSPHEDNLSSCENYKIKTSKALGTMYAQHSLIEWTFGKDQSTTIVVLKSGTVKGLNQESFHK